MLQKTLSALLVSVASQYAELSPSDVGIGIGGGRLVIDNVKLRAETFNSDALPFYVHQGRAGRLRINVPWSALSSSAVEVYLENVHLIAAPKLAPQHLSPTPHTSTTLPTSGPQMRKGNAEGSFAKRDWHQTMVGRLLFNVSVEMFGIKLEYRDDNCVSILSVASLRAFSTGPDWQIRFVSLIEDSGPHLPHSTTTAVAMRKLVKLSGVHCVMIPLLNPKVPHSGDSPPELDRHSFESRVPILDGIAVSVRVLLCTGAAYTQTNPDHLCTGLHAEVEVDVEDAELSLTARQVQWIDHIMKQGFGLGASGENVPPLSPASFAIGLPAQKRRPRRPIPPELSRPSVNAGIEKANGQLQDGAMFSKSYSTTASPPLPSDSESVNSSQNANSTVHDMYRDENVDAEIEEISDVDDDGKTDNPAVLPIEPSRGGLRSLWQAIVSENGDETIDDAAIALGLTNSVEESSTDLDDGPGSGEDHADFLFARDAVEAAANAGGATFQLRIRTPDMAAWDEVEDLRASLRKERDLRGRLENVEAILEEAEERVKSSEEEVRQLKGRNEALVRELQDLERMTSQAGKNKDAMIRQMEASLASAERQLQAMSRAESERDRAVHSVLSEVGESTPTRHRKDLGAESEPHLSRDVYRRKGEELAEEVEAENRDEVREASIHTDLDESEQEDIGNESEKSSFGCGGCDDEESKGGLADINAAECGRDRDKLSPHILTEVAQRGHVEQIYFSKVGASKLEETISLDGLTLI